MHGLGNDFIVIDNTNNNIDLSPQTIQNLADRNFGIGFDQLLMVEKPTNPDIAEFKYRIFNANGGEVEQCGNGARCFAKFVTENNLTTNNPIIVETKNGIISLLITNDLVEVDMGSADFNPQSIVKNIDKHTSYTIAGFDMGLVSMGNPHAVLVVDDIDKDIEKTAKKIQNADEFVNGVNVGFMQIIDKNHIKLRVYERGSGETLACGSGACAAVNVGVANNLLENNVKVSLKGGECYIKILKNNTILIGEAKTVFKGQIVL